MTIIAERGGGEKRALYYTGYYQNYFNIKPKFESKCCKFLIEISMTMIKKITVKYIKRNNNLTHFCCVWLFMMPWTLAHQVFLSMGFSRQEYWTGLPFPPPGDLLDPGNKPEFLTSHALAGRFFTTSTT